MPLIMPAVRQTSPRHGGRAKTLLRWESSHAARAYPLDVGGRLYGVGGCRLRLATALEAVGTTLGALFDVGLTAIFPATAFQSSGRLLSHLHELISCLTFTYFLTEER